VFTDPENLSASDVPFTLTRDNSGNYHLGGLTNTIVSTTGTGGLYPFGNLHNVPVSNPYQLRVLSGVGSRTISVSVPSAIDFDTGSSLAEVPAYSKVTINSQLSTPLYLDGLDLTRATANDTSPALDVNQGGFSLPTPTPTITGQSAA